MDPVQRLQSILNDVARAAGIEPSKESFRAKSRSLERWNDKQWNAVGSDDVYFYSVAGNLFDWIARGGPNWSAFGPLEALHDATRKARHCGMKSVAKRLGRVLAHYRAIAANG